MKINKFLILAFLVVKGVLMNAQSVSSNTNCGFTISNPSNTYTITCNNTNVLLTTSVTSGGPFSYTWIPSCAPQSVGASYNFTQSCSGQVVATTTDGCTHTETFVVFQDFTAPAVVVTPTTMNITCNTAASSFTGTSNLGPNVTTNWYQIIGTNTVFVGVPQQTINIFQPGASGIYWFSSVNNLTGCSSSKSVQVTSSLNVPQFTVTSPSNFTVGCSTKSVTSMQVSSVTTNPANLSVEYFFAPPPGTLVPTWGPNPNQNGITVPGTWVVYVRDQTNLCVTTQSVSIIQNTVAPNVDYIQPLSILSCRNPSMVLNGISVNSNVVITWTVPAIPSNSVNPTSNTTVNINPAVASSSANITSIGFFTVGAVDNNNLCKSTKTLQVLQDLRLPIFTISALSNSIITCANLDVLITPITTTVLAGALVPQYFWYPPVGSGSASTSFNSTAPGIHTCVATSITNGCTTSATYNVAKDVTAPAVGVAPNFTLDCSSNPTVSVFPSITGTTTGFTYSWTVIPAGAITSNLTSSLLTTNKTGSYTILVTNSLTGCFTIQGYSVTGGAMTADFNATPSGGYAPLVVTFSNTSSTSTGASSIISTWSYGNGAVTPTVLNTQPTSATYTTAGTYSVMLVATKGACVDSAMKLIKVELPSKLEVPNVFTPNGDKSNDIFRLKATNLASIEVVIFDRWGNRVYEVVSETGNFAWDGKTLAGKDAPEGTYFYVIKAIGKDDTAYDQKGNVSLFR